MFFFFLFLGGASVCSAFFNVRGFVLHNFNEDYGLIQTPGKNRTLGISRNWSMGGGGDFCLSKGVKDLKKDTKTNKTNVNFENVLKKHHSRTARSVRG